MRLADLFAAPPFMVDTLFRQTIQARVWPSDRIPGVALRTLYPHTETVNRTAKALGLEKMLARKPQALSGGQRQRVALGRAIVRNPKVFLFDEPSNPSLAGTWARRSFLAFGLGSVIARIQGDHIFHLGEKVPVQLDLDKVTLFDPSTENVIK